MSSGIFGLGLFKWRQLETEVVLLAVGIGTCAFPCSTRRRRVARRGGFALPTRHGWGDGFSGMAPECAVRTRQWKPQLTAGAWTRTYVVGRQGALPVSSGGFPGGAHPRFPSLGQETQPRLRTLSSQSGAEQSSAPRVLNTAGHAAYPSALRNLKAKAMDEDCRHRPGHY